MDLCKYRFIIYNCGILIINLVKKKQIKKLNNKIKWLKKSEQNSKYNKNELLNDTYNIFFNPILYINCWSNLFINRIKIFNMRFLTTKKYKIKKNIDLYLILIINSFSWTTLKNYNYFVWKSFFQTDKMIIYRIYINLLKSQMAMANALAKNGIIINLSIY